MVKDSFLLPLHAPRACACSSFRCRTTPELQGTLTFRKPIRDRKNRKQAAGKRPAVAIGTLRPSSSMVALTLTGLNLKR